MTYKIIVTPEASQQIQTVNAWWRDNRFAAPELFSEEFAQTIENLRMFPLIGHRYSHPTVTNIRRILLRSTRYHIYYRTEEHSIFVLAVWSAVRGNGPDLNCFSE